MRKDSYILSGSSMILSKINGNADRQDTLNKQGSTLIQISAYGTKYSCSGLNGDLSLLLGLIL